MGEELIKIDRVLFNHIAKDKARTPDELHKRLNIIPLAFILIEKINIYQKHTIEASKQTEFWTLTGVIDSTRLDVLIRQVGGLEKQAYSVVFKGSMPIDLDKKRAKVLLE